MSRPSLLQGFSKRLPTFTFLTAILLCFGLLDEIISGFPFIGVPLIRDQLKLSYEQIGLIFTVGEVSAMIFDPLMNLYSDRGSKRLWVLGGLLGIAFSFILAGLTTNYTLLLIAFMIYYPSVTATNDIAQATLIDQNPNEGTRTMTRWTLLAGIGDLLSPLTVTAIVSLHLGWSALCWVAATLCFAVFLLVAPQSFPQHTATHTDEEEDEPKESIFASLKTAFRDPILLRWVALSCIPTMVDEIFLGFSSLYLHDVVHLDEATIGIVITIHMIGGVLGLFVLDRMALYRRFSPRRLLAILALASLVGLLMFLATHSVWVITIALFVVGLSIGGWYPIAMGQAYAQRPGRSGLVRAIINFTTPFQVALPIVVGFLSERFGLLAGIGFLSLAPIFILLLLIGRTSH